MKLILAAAFALACTQAHALDLEGKEAHGGNAVVCNNADGSIKSVQLMDFYEGRILYGLTIPTTSEPYVHQYQTVAADLDRIQAQWTFGFHENAFRKIDQSIKLLPAGVRLKPVSDSKDILIPADCSVEQLALYIQNGSVQVVSDFWNAMSETDKAGLVAHEALYAIDRVESDATDSVRARKVNAYAFSRFPFVAVPQIAPKPAILCMHLDDNREARLAFSLIPDGKNTTIEFQQTPDGILYSRLSGTIPDTNLFDYFVRRSSNVSEVIGDYGNAESILDGRMNIRIDVNFDATKGPTDSDAKLKIWPYDDAEPLDWWTFTCLTDFNPVPKR